MTHLCHSDAPASKRGMTLGKWAAMPLCGRMINTPSFVYLTHRINGKQGLFDILKSTSAKLRHDRATGGRPSGYSATIRAPRSGSDAFCRVIRRHSGICDLDLAGRSM
jgi:hypothetical protein